MGYKQPMPEPDDAVFGALCKGAKNTTLNPIFLVGRLAQNSTQEPSTTTKKQNKTSNEEFCFKSLDFIFILEFLHQ